MTRRRVAVIGAGAAGTLAAIFAAAARRGDAAPRAHRRRWPEDPDQRRRPLQHPPGARRRAPLRHRFLAQLAPQDPPLVAARRADRVLRARARACRWSRRRSRPSCFPPPIARATCGTACWRCAARRGARFLPRHVGHRPRSRGDAGWRVRAPSGAAPLDADAVIVATGGLSVPKTGSDGTGLAILERLGPRDASDVRGAHADHRRRRRLRVAGRRVAAGDDHARDRTARRATASGGFLFTHHGYSGPVGARRVARRGALARRAGAAAARLR